MKLNPLWLSLPILILTSGCISRPKLNPYIPKENTKITYVAKDVPVATKKNSVKNYLDVAPPPAPIAKANAAATLLISEVGLDPDPVAVNHAFDFYIKFKANIPSSENKITTIFYFKIIQGNKTLFTSKFYSLKVDNGKMTTRTQHMNPVAVAGKYVVKVFVKHQKLQAEKSIPLIIKKQ
jgi:hypothetical protein